MKEFDPRRMQIDESLQDMRSFAYTKPSEASFRFPEGTGPGNTDGYARQDAFSATGLKREVKCWARHQFFGLNKYIRDTKMLKGDANIWPRELPQAELPELFSLQHRQSARIEWRTVQGIPGRQKLIEDMTKIGIKEGTDFRFFDTELSTTCGSIQFRTPWQYKLFLRFAADHAVHDKTNQGGWRLHPFDAVYPYLHHDVFIKAFCIEGLRMPRSGPPVMKKNQTTIDIVTNWPMNEQISEALRYLNTYTKDTLQPFYAENHRRFENGEPLVAQLPELPKEFAVKSETRWAAQYRAKDYTAMVHRKNMAHTDDWTTINADRKFGVKPNEDCWETMNMYFELNKQAIQEELSSSKIEERAPTARVKKNKTINLSEAQASWIKFDDSDMAAQGPIDCSKQRKVILSTATASLVKYNDLNTAEETSIVLPQQKTTNFDKAQASWVEFDDSDMAVESTIDCSKQQKVNLSETQATRVKFNDLNTTEEISTVYPKQEFKLHRGQEFWVKFDDSDMTSDTRIASKKPNFNDSAFAAGAQIVSLQKKTTSLKIPTVSENSDNFKTAETEQIVVSQKTKRHQNISSLANFDFLDTRFEARKGHQHQFIDDRRTTTPEPINQINQDVKCTSHKTAVSKPSPFSTNSGGIATASSAHIVSSQQQTITNSKTSTPLKSTLDRKMALSVPIVPTKRKKPAKLSMKPQNYPALREKQKNEVTKILQELQQTGVSFVADDVKASCLVDKISESFDGILSVQSEIELSSGSDDCQMADRTETVADMPCRATVPKDFSYYIHNAYESPHDWRMAAQTSSSVLQRSFSNTDLNFVRRAEENPNNNKANYESKKSNQKVSALATQCRYSSLFGVLCPLSPMRNLME